MTGILSIKKLWVFVLILFIFKDEQVFPVQIIEKQINDITIQIKNRPLFIERPNLDVIAIKVETSGTENPKKIKGIMLHFSKSSNLNDVSEIELNYGGALTAVPERHLFGKIQKPGKDANIDGTYPLVNGYNIIQISFTLNADANLLSKISLANVEIVYDDKSVSAIKTLMQAELRFAKIVRAKGQDKCDTYRIPGLATTNKGTLIAVYDSRYNNGADLQENIDIGMSRSTDGGQTWEPLKIIMDMGEWGGKPQQENGVGDPAVLVDTKTNTVWVAALWAHGNPGKRTWWASNPGMKPEETGQVMLVNSTDDGKTWSAPINITEQIKTSEWQLLLQGPGRGITTEDGTLVFASQFKKDIGVKAADGGKYTCHSTIIFSRDKGKTWSIGSGAKPNTTESQVVQLADGSLMLNMRDDLNRKDKGETNGRAVAITNDMGKTWTMHFSSNCALPEPNCMASLISTLVKIKGNKKQVLFFSNPNNKTTRSNMTIKASIDGGKTWPTNYQLELNEEKGFGYSCMTMVDDKTVGILYEGEKELYFQKVKVSDLLMGLVKNND